LAQKQLAVNGTKAQRKRTPFALCAVAALREIQFGTNQKWVRKGATAQRDNRLFALRALAGVA